MELCRWKYRPHPASQGILISRALFAKKQCNWSNVIETKGNCLVLLGCHLTNWEFHFWSVQFSAGWNPRVQIPTIGFVQKTIYNGYSTTIHTNILHTIHGLRGTVCRWCGTENIGKWGGVRIQLDKLMWQRLCETCQSLACAAGFHALKRPYLRVLEGLFTSQNGLVLTETRSPPPPGICSTKPAISQERSNQFQRSFARWKSLI